MSYLGVPPFGQTVRTTTELTATAAQTTFTPAGGYLPGYIDVFMNGVLLDSSDYTATNGSTVVLTAAAALDDEIKTIAYWPVSLIDTYRKAEVDAAISGAGVPSGTKMMFVQTAAPTGWTKDTTHDNKALRVVSGTASTGGSVAFTTAFASQSVAGTVGSTTLSTSEIPAHAHTHLVYHDYGYGAGAPNRTTGMVNGGGGAANLSGNNTGGGGSHNHSFTGTAINMAVSYVDTIIATKD